MLTSKLVARRGEDRLSTLFIHGGVSLYGVVIYASIVRLSSLVG